MIDLKTALLSAQKYFLVLSPAAFIIILARFVEPEIYGKFSLIEAIGSIFAIFSLQALDGPFQINYLSRHFSSGIFNCLLVIKLSLAILGYGLFVSTIFLVYGIEYAAISSILGLMILVRSLYFIESIVIFNSIELKYSAFCFLILSIGLIFKILLVTVFDKFPIIAILYIFDFLVLSIFLFLFTPPFTINKTDFIATIFQSRSNNY
jgi:hypothetical protein